MSREPSGRGAKRFIRPLPPNPNLDKQSKLAKALARDYWRGKADTVERVPRCTRNPRLRKILS